MPSRGSQQNKSRDKISAFMQNFWSLEAISSDRKEGNPLLRKLARVKLLPAHVISARDLHLQATSPCARSWFPPPRCWPNDFCMRVFRRPAWAQSHDRRVPTISVQTYNAVHTPHSDNITPHTASRETTVKNCRANRKTAECGRQGLNLLIRFGSICGLQSVDLHMNSLHPLCTLSAPFLHPLCTRTAL